ncbi:ArsR/SmtB family transcription factor [Leptospira sarikeiensis]|uniref:ArsR family transcriptional regulator n=1 Tax=Leptospira sarikeiensis TaxID=2484943 RepID=A0A4R9K981_9LEPT|nr:metalloregulator ArsR/SmtB family transcription factor [Leptospira sarikeiensis]TGL62066.1 ArsR family transcriptional regulator [Leptospira sarikeiensis]
MVESKVYDLDLIFQALSDPTRRAMLRSLSKKERVITEIAEPFEMSLAAASKHIKVLERAKLVHRRKEGSFSYLSLNSKAMMSADKWIGYYRRFWEEQLDSLKNLLEGEE